MLNNATKRVSTIVFENLRKNCITRDKCWMLQLKSAVPRLLDGSVRKNREMFEYFRESLSVHRQSLHSSIVWTRKGRIGRWRRAREKIEKGN